MHRRLRRIAITATILATLATVGCNATPKNTSSADRMQIYATTGYLADALHNIAPEAEVTTMVGPGGDPHTHQPSTKDIKQIMDSDVVFWNGLHLEAQMIDQLASLGDAQLAVGDQLPEELLLPLPDTDDAGKPLFDPHIWNSPEAWSLVVELIADKLAAVDPKNAGEYETNATAYIAEITAAATEAHELLAQVAAPRILITGHDAFAYFGETFDIDVRATDFISTQAYLSPRELSDLAELIATQQVPVIFKDNQANPQAITSLREAVRAKGWNVQVSDDELYADSLGAAPGVDTYLGVFRHNATAVAAALSESTS